VSNGGYWVIYAMFAIVFAGITGWLASKRGRSVAGWVVASLFFSPVLCWIILSAVGQKKVEVKA